MVHAVETGTISSLMNTGADCILAGDKSSIKEEYQGCLDAGMSNGEAIVSVGVLEGGKLLENAAQGVISTAGFHGIGKVTTTLGTHMGIIDGPSHVDTDGLREPEADGRISADKEPDVLKVLPDADGNGGKESSDTQDITS